MIQSEVSFLWFENVGVAGLQGNSEVLDERGIKIGWVGNRFLGAARVLRMDE